MIFSIRVSYNWFIIFFNSLFFIRLFVFDVSIRKICVSFMVFVRKFFFGYKLL